MKEKFDYIFPENLTIKQLDKVYKELKKIQSNKKKNIKFDLRSLKTMDIPSLQLFASLIRELKTQGKELLLQGPLDPLFQDNLEELDMIRSGADYPLLFVQIEGGCSIECQ
jgi:ABC-type transporter Mla MlaB component